MMDVRLHPHAQERVAERGTTEAEVRRTVLDGERFPAKFGRAGFRMRVDDPCIWRGKPYVGRIIEAIAVEEEDDWLVVTVLVKFVREEKR